MRVLVADSPSPRLCLPVRPGSVRCLLSPLSCALCPSHTHRLSRVRLLFWKGKVWGQVDGESGGSAGWGCFPTPRGSRLPAWRPLGCTLCARCLPGRGVRAAQFGNPSPSPFSGDA